MSPDAALGANPNPAGRRSPARAAGEWPATLRAVLRVAGPGDPTRSLQDRDHDLLDAGGDLALHAGRGKLMPGAAAHPHLSQDVPVAVLVEDELGLGVLSGLEAVGQGKRAVVVAPNEQSALRDRNVVGSGRKRRPADRETERDLAPDLGRFDGRGKGREHGHETHRPETLEKLLRHLTLLGRRVVAAAMKDESSRGLFGAGPKS